jgi:hypothetical protein
MDEKTKKIMVFTGGFVLVFFLLHNLVSADYKEYGERYDKEQQRNLASQRKCFSEMARTGSQTCNY